MEAKFTFRKIFGWLFTLLIFTLGVMNLVLVHPVPGFAYMLLSLIFLPPLNSFLKERTGWAIPRAVQIVLGIIIIWFTLGISDLAEIIGL